MNSDSRSVRAAGLVSGSTRPFATIRQTEIIIFCLPFRLDWQFLLLTMPVDSSLLLGPFHGAIAVPSVTRCRCRRRRRRRGHRCAGGVRRDSSDTW